MWLHETQSNGLAASNSCCCRVYEASGEALSSSYDASTMAHAGAALAALAPTPANNARLPPSRASACNVARIWCFWPPSASCARVLATSCTIINGGTVIPDRDRLTACFRDGHQLVIGGDTATHAERAAKAVWLFSRAKGRSNAWRIFLRQDKTSRGSTLYIVTCQLSIANLQAITLLHMCHAACGKTACCTRQMDSKIKLEIWTDAYQGRGDGGCSSTAEAARGKVGGQHLHPAGLLAAVCCWQQPSPDGLQQAPVDGREGHVPRQRGSHT